MIIGIDLGTTNSVAAYLADDGPRLIPNALGEVLTPSVVGVDESGAVVVGRTRKNCACLIRTAWPACSSGTWAATGRSN